MQEIQLPELLVKDQDNARQTFCQILQVKLLNNRDLKVKING